MENLGKMFSTGYEKAKEAANQAMSKDSPLEKNLKEACANTNWGASTSLLAEIARDSFDYSCCCVIMKYVWEAIGDKPTKWRRVLKALTLIDYLCKNGTERIVEEVRESVYRIRVLMDFHVTEDGRDRGSGIREKAKWIVELVNDVDLLKEERSKSLANRHKFVGIGGRGERTWPTQFPEYDGLGSFNNRTSDNYGYGGGGSQGTFSRGYDPHPGNTRRGSGPSTEEHGGASERHSGRQERERRIREEYDKDAARDDSRAQAARDKARLERERRRNRRPEKTEKSDTRSGRHRERRGSTTRSDSQSNTNSSRSQSQDSQGAEEPVGGSPHKGHRQQNRGKGKDSHHRKGGQEQSGSSSNLLDLDMPSNTGHFKENITPQADAGFATTSTWDPFPPAFGAQMGGTSNEQFGSFVSAPVAASPHQIPHQMSNDDFFGSFQSGGSFHGAPVPGQSMSGQSVGNGGQLLDNSLFAAVGQQQQQQPPPQMPNAIPSNNPFGNQSPFATNLGTGGNNQLFDPNLFTLSTQQKQSPQVPGGSTSNNPFGNLL